jgi:hypothetical protein
MERRKVLGLLGGSMTVALAGCGGGGDDNGNESNGNESNGNESNGNESNGNGNGNGDPEPTLTDAFVAESQGGLLAIGENSLSAAEEGGFSLPPSDTVPEPIVVDGEITDGEWESTNIELPNLDSEALLGQIGGEDLPINPEDVEIQLSVPNGFSGTLDQEEGMMTVEGQLTITVILSGQEVPIEIGLDGTTGESGNMTGSADFSSEPVSATIVDNQAQVPALDEEEFSLIGPIVNDQLGLPSGPDSENGRTWLRIIFEITNADGSNGGNGGDGGNESS